jgi:hypothetical protein
MRSSLSAQSAVLLTQVLLTLMPAPWDLQGMLLLVARWHELGCGGDMVQVGRCGVLRDIAAHSLAQCFAFPCSVVLFVSLDVIVQDLQWTGGSAPATLPRRWCYLNTTHCAPPCRQH